MATSNEMKILYDKNGLESLLDSSNLKEKLESIVSHLYTEEAIQCFINNLSSISDKISSLNYIHYKKVMDFLCKWGANIQLINLIEEKRTQYYKQQKFEDVRQIKEGFFYVFFGLSIEDMKKGPIKILSQSEYLYQLDIDLYKTILKIINCNDFDYIKLMWDDFKSSAINFRHVLYDMCDKVRTLSAKNIIDSLYKIPSDNNKSEINVIELNGPFYLLVKTSKKAEYLMEPLVPEFEEYSSFALISHKTRAVYNKNATIYAYNIKNPRHIIHVYDGDSMTGMDQNEKGTYYSYITQYPPKFVSAKTLINKSVENRIYNEIAALTIRDENNVFMPDAIVCFDGISDYDYRKAKNNNINNILLLNKKNYPGIFECNCTHSQSKIFEKIKKF